MTHMSLLKLIFFMFTYVCYFCWINIMMMWNKGLSLLPLDAQIYKPLLLVRKDVVKVAH